MLKKINQHEQFFWYMQKILSSSLKFDNFHFGRPELYVNFTLYFQKHYSPILIKKKIMHTLH